MGVRIGITAKSIARETMRALNLPWQEFKSKFLEEFNGDELQINLQLELLSTHLTMWMFLVRDPPVNILISNS